MASRFVEASLSNLETKRNMFPSRMLLARSVWKGPNIVPLPIIRVPPGQKAPPIQTQARSATILPNFVGLVFQVHNGKIYHDVEITEDMVGHKLGEFSPTRAGFSYKMSKNK
ncbi:37S ribosomal protein S19, mitochondrial [Lachnellula subtilissima]|uniref:37S ribosomal protein S19, mitochondrial n=1 Tax=Lachnellula subtilissima TaxID=602034 RepID=A0A8H8RXG0_9HELO|nr:37S ribosomal protein S19, mitochondrial [Lachnellula subtilissima]